jgi:tRNA-dihydrouridine synthase A
MDPLGVHLGAMSTPHRLAVAPMMDRTDRHCRFFHRRLTRRALLFTEMITAEAVIRGDRAALLGFDVDEHPIALQLGGSDPASLAEAARIGADYGYDEINLNVGCPSSRVQSGSFGACLMLEPARVGACVAAMKGAVNVPVTVKCRLGVDDQDIETTLDRFAGIVVEAGVDGIWVHARKAWLRGLDPKQNRTAPPLDHARVHRLKRRLPRVFVGINGGFSEIEACAAELTAVGGVMIGRAAYNRPAILGSVDRLIYRADTGDADRDEAALAMVDYAGRACRAGVPLGRVVRPMLGLFHGSAGARAWRRTLTEGAAARPADCGVIRDALAAWRGAADRQAAMSAEMAA